MAATDDQLWQTLERKRVQARKLANSRSALVERLINQIAEKWRAEELSPAELLQRYATLRDNYLPGFDRQWREALPGMDYDTLVRLAGCVEPGFVRTEWAGQSWPPAPTDDVPRRGQPVTYLLIDDEGRVAYVGSTDWFLTRMRMYNRKGRRPAQWRAVACESRDDAYAMEQRLIDEHSPYLNKLKDVRPAQPAVDVGGYWRYRFGRQEFVRTHNRGSRSASPDGYRKNGEGDEPKAQV